MCILVLDMSPTQSEDVVLDPGGLLLDSSGPKKLTCAFCRKIFECVEKLKAHIHDHTFPMFVPFDVIESVGPVLAGLPEFINPGQFSRFQCPKCPASFTLKSNMDRHEKTIHFNRKKMQCSACLKLFRDKTDLNRHLMSVHSSERSFMCLFCGKSFGTQKNLTTHMKVCYLGSMNNIDQNQESDDEWENYRNSWIFSFSFLEARLS